MLFRSFKDIQLPDWLAFFSGKRFVAIATGLISILVSVVLLFVWPVIFDALVALGSVTPQTNAQIAADRTRPMVSNQNTLFRAWCRPVWSAS